MDGVFQLRKSVVPDRQPTGCSCATLQTGVGPNIKHEPLLQAPHEGEVLASSFETRRLATSCGSSPPTFAAKFGHTVLHVAIRVGVRVPKMRKNAGARRAAGVQTCPLNRSVLRVVTGLRGWSSRLSLSQEKLTRRTASVAQLQSCWAVGDQGVDCMASMRMNAIRHVWPPLFTQA
jgi:hypothetical protein